MAFVSLMIQRSATILVIRKNLLKIDFAQLRWSSEHAAVVLVELMAKSAIPRGAGKLIGQ